MGHLKVERLEYECLSSAQAQSFRLVFIQSRIQSAILSLLELHATLV